MNIDRTTPLWDTALPEEERIAWLLGAMTPEEKMSWISGFNKDVERIGVPGFSVGGEAAHGVQARNDQGGSGIPQPTTSFVQPIGMSATWDPDLLEEAGRVTGTEARIIANENGGRGLSRWAPTVDLERDPRWGRNEEGYGEDPFLTGKMAGAYVRGMQGPDPKHLLCASTLKHFYGNNTERCRSWKSAFIDNRNKAESYHAAFIRVIREGRPEGIMTAYNRINGVPGIMNREVRDILKKRYGLHHAVGDGGAVNVAWDLAGERGTPAEIVAEALKAGVDSMSDFPVMIHEAVKEAYEFGLITEADLDRSITNMMRTKIRLGLYDRDESHPYRKIAPERMHCQEHKDICRRVSREAMVLLKNAGGKLPLGPATTEKGIALIGPWAECWLQDWYGGEPAEKITIKQGLEQLYGLKCETGDGFDRVTFRLGGRPVQVAEDGGLFLAETGDPDVFVYEDWGNNNILLRLERNHRYVTQGKLDENDGERIRTERPEAFDWFVTERFHVTDAGNGNVTLKTRFDLPVVIDPEGRLRPGKPEDMPATFEKQVTEVGLEKAVRMAEANGTVILALGCHPMVNAKEEEDRTTLMLPPCQLELLEKTGKHGIVVLCSNYPYTFEHLDELPDAILWTATGAQDIGAAVAETLMGDNDPAGRLNMTWYADDGQLTGMDEYDLVRGKRTYRYFDGMPLYPFGYGLSYTTFAYRNPAVEKNANGDFRVSFDVINTGNVAGDEVAQVYRVACDGDKRGPVKQLCAFTRLKEILPGETRHVALEIPLDEMRLFDPAKNEMTVQTADFRLEIGPDSVNLPLGMDVHTDGAEPSIRSLKERVFADTWHDCENVILIPGPYGLQAATPRENTGHVVYMRCDAATLTEKILLRMNCRKDGCVKVKVDGKMVASWEGTTLDGHSGPRFFPDELTRAEEPDRLAAREPKYRDILIPMELSNANREGLCSVELELTGDPAIVWFMCI